MASSQGNELDQTYIAESSLAALQYTAVIAGAADYGCAPATAGARVLGINQGKAASGAAAQIRTARGTTSKLLLTGTVTVGMPLKADTGGSGIDGSANLDKAFCVALQAGVTGDIIEVMLADFYTAAS